ncbi:hypothetical protein HS088_TW16G00827 [Tripterygium wilfordii]|uniref:MADS-box domain-containing protein n=1 Tax=Tripterygium wilfordii TaxID=458696 RepID=A0A7J7CK03_TRIWF|nr:agamous-like MADS-box protein AGL62 [Tripterygium wilfordii]KAF5734378.1 hypothetical protein HS088_TW16G00827 [Tripterygium wilfordii]
MVRHTTGRRKQEMKKMTNEKNLQVTFSKRKNNIFKKASELSILCDVEIVIIVFSPANKAFAFGNPSVESVLNRYLSENPPPMSGTLQLAEAYRRSNVRNLNSELTQVVNELEAEKKRAEDLRKMRLASQAECWWEKPIEEQSVEELQRFKRALENLRENIAQEAQALEFQSSPQFGTKNDEFDAGFGI